MATTESSALAQAPQDEREARCRVLKERTTRGLLAYNRGDVMHLEADVWAVRASEGGYWLVDYAAETCNCPDNTYRAEALYIPCKHLAAVGIANAARRDHRPHACDNGWVYLGVEEDGVERVEAVPCKRCIKEGSGA